MNHNRSKLYQKNNDKASVGQVQSFLDDFFEKWDKYDWYLRLDRDENQEALYELDLDSADVAEYLRSLTPANYYAGPIIDTKPYPRAKNPGPLWEFGTMVGDTEVYVKLRLGVPGTKAICVSFHLPNFVMDYPLRQKP